MVTVRPPLWDRAFALAGAFAIAGLFFPMALVRRNEPAPVRADRCPGAALELASPAPTPSREFYGDDGIFLRDTSSLEVHPGAFRPEQIESPGSKISRTKKRVEDLRKAERERRR